MPTMKPDSSQWFKPLLQVCNAREAGQWDCATRRRLQSCELGLNVTCSRSLRMHIEPDSLPTGHDGIVQRLQKGPNIHSSAWVVPGATVLGDVILEEESSVWYGAVLRGD